jgi:hypothetical protein
MEGSDEMKLSETNFINAIRMEPEQCVLETDFSQFLPECGKFSSAVLALTFQSGPTGREEAISYVFYFFCGSVDENRQPDDILTFKVRYDSPHKVHIVSKYLGGMAFGAINAPPLSMRQRWRPGMMSPEGKKEFKDTFSQKEEGKQGAPPSKGCSVIIVALVGLAASTALLISCVVA